MNSKTVLFVISFLILALSLIAFACSQDTLNKEFETNIQVNKAITYTDIKGTVGILFTARPSHEILSKNVTYSYSISPEYLPSGLNFDTTTGSIYGTPKEVSQSLNYVVTATSLNNDDDTVISNSFNIDIDSLEAKISEIKQDISRTTIIYTNLQGIVGKFLVLEPIEFIVPIDATLEYSINPKILPDGLTFHTESGLINGTPNTTFNSTSYRVTATGYGNYSGTSVSNSFTIREVSPIQIIGSLVYESETNVQIGTRLNLRPESNLPAHATVSYAISSGTLPSELVFSSETGLISGKLIELMNITLQVTATAEGIYSGTVVSNSFTIRGVRNLTGMLRYRSYNYHQLNERVELNPQNDFPADAIVSYAITLGTLPNDLVISSETGFISGIITAPTNIRLQVTATAENYPGSVLSNSFVLIVDPQAIGGSLEYPPIVGVLNVYLSILPIETPTPVWATFQYSKLTSLPAGLSVHPITGAIEGTPELASTGFFDRQVRVTGTESYTGVKYSNNFKITINQNPPIELTGELNYLFEHPITHVTENHLSFNHRYYNNGVQITSFSPTLTGGNTQDAISNGDIEYSIVGYDDGVQNNQFPIIGLFPFQFVEFDTNTGEFKLVDDAPKLENSRVIRTYHHFLVTAHGINAYTGTITRVVRLYIPNRNQWDGSVW